MENRPRGWHDLQGPTPITVYERTYRHDGTTAKVTATRDDTRPEPYVWTCTCGASRSFPTEHDVFPTAWRHTHRTRFDRLRSWATRLFTAR